jgi:GntR family transcriptional regulator
VPATPRYRQVANSLAAAIAQGRLREGDRLPSERELAEVEGVSRMTARAALRDLEDRGLLAPRSTQGTFVGRRPIEQQLHTLLGFTEEVERQGRRAGSLVIEAGRRAPDPEVARALRLCPGEEVWHIARVRLADGEPVAIEATEIPVALAPGLLEGADLASWSLYATLRARHDIDPATAEQTLMADAADEGSAPPLGLRPGAPVLRLVRVTRDATGRPFEYVRSIYRGDAVVMRARLDMRARA